VSTAVEEHPAVSAGTVSAGTISAILVRRDVLIALASGGVLVAIGAGLLLATSDHLVHPIAYGLMIAVMVAGSFGAALYWLVRRPGNRLGVLLLALGIATAAVSLQGASEPHLHSIGALADSAWFLLAYYVVFAFPEGRIGSRFGWALMGAILLYYLDRYVLWVLFSPVVYGGAPLAGCNAACPANGLMIANRPSIADGIGGPDISPYVIVEMSAILAFLCYRLVTATRPRRRALLPVYVPAVMATVPVLAYYGVLQRVDVTASTLSKVGWVATVGYSTLPWGFLVSVVVSTFFAATALKLIVSRLVESPSASQLRATLADALDDPSLELGFRLERGGGFFDSSGMALAPMPPAGQSASPITQKGETVAVIMHDDALDTDPELVGAAGQATLLAIENGRLTAALHSTTTELQAMRGRIVTAGDAERRRVERDLHDGAQQHLVALIIRVGLASEVADPKVAERLDEVGKELDEILQELRDLAHGLYPTVLRDLGLQAALVTLVRRSVSRVRVETGAIGRYSEEVEAAVYFCCAESLQNVDKHAGSGATAVIRLWEGDGRLFFEIVDDGVGFDVESTDHAGHGLANVSERIAAQGGTLVVESAQGRGTTVRANIQVPDAAAQRLGPVARSGS
jgi:signal transduction histidine kinase